MTGQNFLPNLTRVSRDTILETWITVSSSPVPLPRPPSRTGFPQEPRPLPPAAGEYPEPPEILKQPPFSRCRPRTPPSPPSARGSRYYIQPSQDSPSSSPSTSSLSLTKYSSESLFLHLHHQVQAVPKFGSLPGDAKSVKEEDSKYGAKIIRQPKRERDGTPHIKVGAEKEDAFYSLLLLMSSSRDR